MVVCESTSGMLRNGLLEGVESAWLDAVPIKVTVDLVEVSSKAKDSQHDHDKPCYSQRPYASTPSAIITLSCTLQMSLPVPRPMIHDLPTPLGTTPKPPGPKILLTEVVDLILGTLSMCFVCSVPFF